MINRRLKILAVLPFFIVAAAAFLINTIDLEHLTLRPEQRQLLNFSQGESEMGVEKPETLINTAPVIQTNLFNFERAEMSANADVTSMSQKNSVSERIDYGVPYASVSRPFQKEDVLPNRLSRDANVNPKLTFVVLNGRRSFAIFNDRLLHEGESTGGMTIQKIERNRILVKDKTVRWIHMEEDR